MELYNPVVPIDKHNFQVLAMVISHHTKPLVVPWFEVAIEFFQPWQDNLGKRILPFLAFTWIVTGFDIAKAFTWITKSSVHRST